MHKADKATLSIPSSVSRKRKWQEQGRDVQCALRQLKNQWWVTKAHEAQSFADRYDMHNFYGAVKSIHDPRTWTICPLKTADGFSLIRDQSKIVQRWGEHFEAPLNHPSPVDLSVLEELQTLPTIQSLDLPPSHYCTRQWKMRMGWPWTSGWMGTC